MDGDRAHEAMNNDDEASSWLVSFRNSPNKSHVRGEENAMKQACDSFRNSSKKSHVHGDGAHVKLMNITMKQGYDFWLTVNSYLRHVHGERPHDWLWTTMRQAHEQLIK